MLQIRNVTLEVDAALLRSILLQVEDWFSLHLPTVAKTEQGRHRPSHPEKSLNDVSLLRTVWLNNPLFE